MGKARDSNLKVKDSNTLIKKLKKANRYHRLQPKQRKDYTGWVLKRLFKILIP